MCNYSDSTSLASLRHSQDNEHEPAIETVTGKSVIHTGYGESEHQIATPLMGHVDPGKTSLMGVIGNGHGAESEIVRLLERLDARIARIVGRKEEVVTEEMLNEEEMKGFIEALEAREKVIADKINEFDASYKLNARAVFFCECSGNYFPSNCDNARILPSSRFLDSCSSCYNGNPRRIIRGYFGGRFRPEVHLKCIREAKSKN